MPLADGSGAGAATWTAVVADRVALFRSGVAAALERGQVAVVTTCGRASDALGGLARRRADLLVVSGEVTMPLAEVIREAKRQDHQPAVVALLGPADRSQLSTILTAGGDALLDRGIDPDGLLEAVGTVLAGGRIIDPSLHGWVLDALDRSPRGDGPTLTTKECEVLALVSEGLTNRQIAHELVISPATAKTHVANICRKLEVGNRTQALARAVELGLLD